MHFRWILILTLALAGCAKKGGETTASEEKATPDQTAARPAANANAASQNTVNGKVLERLDASSYSYLRLSTASGEVWAAVPQTTVAVGSEVTIGSQSVIEGFESKTLKRKFDKIIFGTLTGQDQGATIKPATAHEPGAASGAMPQGAMQEMLKQHAGISDASVSGTISVEKAPGPDGRTVAEIFDQKSKLKDQKVAVRGKVVKINQNIMGKTWIHLRDGTGKREANTDDITITTLDSAAVGDTVLVRGTIHTDKDFGMGYFFPVIIEDATIKK